MLISLLGYMGSGKSHVSKILSSKLNYQILDLDKEISRKNKMSITEIFEKKGELYFRKREREILEEILATSENMVISLGGGTPAYFNNMEIINQNSSSIFLRTSVKTLVERLKNQKEKRPIIANIPDNHLPEFISKHLFERNFYYKKARFTVDTDDKTPEEIASEITKLL